MKKINYKKLLVSVLPGLMVALAGCFMLFFYAPFELYLTNHKEFWFTSGQMMPTVLALFLGSFILIALVLIAARIINAKLYTAMLTIGFAAVLALYVQGNFLVKHLPGLDGAVVDWSAYPAERLKSVFVWVAVVLLAAMLIKLLGQKRFANVAGLICAGLALMLGITVGTLFLTVDEVEKSNISVATDRDMFTMSDDKNLVILVLDAIDGCEFEKIIYSNNEYKEYFKDFTYYDNAMSGYPYSDCSETLYLTGVWNEAEMEPAEYVKNAVAASSLFSGLEEQGYSMGLYVSSNFFLQGVPAERFVNLTDKQPGVSSPVFMAKMLMKMAAVKYAPWDLKFFGYDLLGRQDEGKVSAEEDGSGYFDWTNIGFYSKFKDENPVAMTEQAQAKVIHLDGAHVPIRYDKYLNVVEDATYQSGIEGSIYLFAKYVEMLKEAGVYDNTAIVVMSDHGYAAKEYPELNTLQQHPIFLAKGIGEKAEQLRVDNAPVSYEDLPEAFLSLAKGSDGSNIFEWEAGDVRERRFMLYEWTNLNYFEEYIQSGQAEDMDTLLPSGRVFDYAG